MLDGSERCGSTASSNGGAAVTVQQPWPTCRTSWYGPWYGVTPASSTRGTARPSGKQLDVLVSLSFLFVLCGRDFARLRRLSHGQEGVGTVQRVHGRCGQMVCRKGGPTPLNTPWASCWDPSMNTKSAVVWFWCLSSASGTPSRLVGPDDSSHSWAL